LITLLVFIDVGEDLIMVNDVTTSLNPLFVLVKYEKLKKSSLDINVSQWLCEEKLSKIMMRIQIDHLTWDH
jgi:hypothetical protein